MTTNTLSSDIILYLSFNQDASCFAVGTETGFKIYSSYPLNHCYERNLNGGIGIIMISLSILIGSYLWPVRRIAKMTLRILHAITISDCIFFSGLSGRVV